jgi:hypothetical protein
MLNLQYTVRKKIHNMQENHHKQLNLKQQLYFES